MVFKVDEDKSFQRDFTLSTDRRFTCVPVLSLGVSLVKLGVAWLSGLAWLRWVSQS
jgi:hypothetical protein